MKMKIIASFAFLFNAFLFGTYYSVAKEALERVDPIVFTFLTMIALAPVGLCILLCARKHVSRETVKSGALLGSCLGLGLFTLSVALKYNSATGTAFFPSLNGFLAAIFAWIFLRQPINKMTWVAGVISVGGAVLLITNAEVGGARGASIAFIGGLLCTFYVFLADQEQRDKQAYWALFGVELLTMATWAGMIALLFGNWQAVHLQWNKDPWIILYISFGTTFLPTLMTVLLQKYIKPLTVSFIYILEPVLGAIFAYLYLHENMPLYGYIGGAVIVIGAVVNTWGTAQQPGTGATLRQHLLRLGEHFHSSPTGTLLYPLICFGLGMIVVFKLGGLPPTSWSALYRVAPSLGTYWQQSNAAIILLIAQAISWLIAWIALISIGILAMYRALDRLFATKTPAQPTIYDYHASEFSPITSTPGEQHVPRRHYGSKKQFVDAMEMADW